MLGLKDLSFNTALAILGTVLVSYFFLSSVSTWYRLRIFPGPFLASFSYLFLARVSFSGKSEVIYTNLNRTHGPLVRIGPNELITDDPEIVRRMSAARSPYGRSRWYKAGKLNPHRDNMFSQLDVTEHDRLKAQVAAGYAGKENLALESGIEAQIGGLVKLIRTKYLTTASEYKPVDLSRLVQYFTLDTITNLAFGSEFGYLETESDIFDYIKILRNTIVFFQLCGDLPFLRRIFFSNLGLRLLAPKAGDQNGMGKLMTYVK
jgi:hypothetical protein